MGFNSSFSHRRDKVIFLVDPNSITRVGKIIFSFSLKLFNRWKGHTVSSPDQVNKIGNPLVANRSVF